MLARQFVRLYKQQVALSLVKRDLSVQFRCGGVVRGNQINTFCTQTDIEADPYTVKKIGRDDVDVTFVRASGPGGQAVNKTSSKVNMKFDLEGVRWLSEEVKSMVRQKEKNRISKEGYLTIQSMIHREQHKNLEDALEKLQKILNDAAEAARPHIMGEDMKQKLEKQKRRANENRLKEKKMAQQKKMNRKSGKRGEF
eukprot:TRINITY_DN1738_c0_g1_i9.p2 TRINITY_DN1738_c0_g1~~TRINITY_DN1738_c0_g1_i9.p2  ORF type:complete len:197 (-),score=32.08 TRINITY_DN1738_c0_g1_i9:476-1066(-)